MDTLMGDTRPEAVYFTIDDGQRAAYFLGKYRGLSGPAKNSGVRVAVLAS